MRRLIKKMLRRIYLEDFAIDFLSNLRRTRRSILWHVKRDLVGTDRRIIDDYFKEHKVRKLNIGCGPNAFNGWFNSNYYPQSAQIIHLDATEPFPFDNDIFDYVYSEHMIEHISWHEGLFMLRECRRVLKPGGTIRIATPNLEVLIGLYSYNGDPLNERYIKWITDRYLNGINVYKASFVINNAFRDWGHQFLYDGELIEIAMQEAGFMNMHRCSPGESDDENLRGIESHGKNVADDDMAAFETMVFEGKCPV